MMQNATTKDSNRQLPTYAPARLIQQHCARLSASRLRIWARRGWIRCAKLGSSKQSAALYRVADVMELLERTSRGEAPRRKVRR